MRDAEWLTLSNVPAKVLYFIQNVIYLAAAAMLQNLGSTAHVTQPPYLQSANLHSRWAGWYGEEMLLTELPVCSCFSALHVFKPWKDAKAVLKARN